MNKFEQEYELYYQKYGYIAPVYEVPTKYNEAETYIDRLRCACNIVITTQAGIPEMAYTYEVDEQELYDFVRCQRAHERWLDRLDEARYIGA